MVKNLIRPFNRMVGNGFVFDVVTLFENRKKIPTYADSMKLCEIFKNHVNNMIPESDKKQPRKAAQQKSKKTSEFSTKGPAQPDIPDVRFHPFGFEIGNS
jgi:hypothetical protein